MVEAGLLSREHTRSPRTTQELVLRYPAGTPRPFDNRTVIAFEQITEELDGACVAYADGHAACVTLEEYYRLLP